jgi:tetratricopeptide (TPR) repeat protein
MDPTAIDGAREALRLAEADPVRSVELASAVIDNASGSHYDALAVAERALGLAAIQLEDLDTAIDHLRRAIRYGQRAQSPVLVAEARMTYAYLRTLRGQSASALKEIDSAIVDLYGLERARAHAQRGAILQQLGRLDEALACYRTALPALRRTGDDLWTLRVSSNRGVLHATRHEFAAAQTDLRAAEQLSARLDSDLWSAFVHHNLGWLSSLRGDAPTALRHLDTAEQKYRLLNSHVGLVLQDRGELLLSVGLVSEANAVLAEAAEELQAEKRHVAVPEVQLLRSHAAMRDDDSPGAMAHADRATRGFDQQGRDAWAELARSAALIAKAAGPARRNISIAMAERSADALDAFKWRAAALEARILAARLALDRNQLAKAQRQLTRAGSRRRRGPARLRARAWYAEAVLRLSKENTRGATSALRAGLRILDEHSATFGATDLRAHAANHRTELADLGLEIAMRDDDVRRVFEWAEQARASRHRIRPALPPDDPSLAAMLAALRATTAEISQRRRADQDAATLVRSQVTQEHSIRDYCRSREAGGTAIGLMSPVAARTVLEALGDATMIEFFQLDGVLHAVVLCGGRIRHYQLGRIAELRDLISQAAFALHRLARRAISSTRRSAALLALRHAGGRIDDMVLKPLAAQMADRDLIVVPTDPLQSLTWPILPSCTGRSVTMSPSATLWHHSRLRGTAHTATAAVAAGPGLAAAHTEAAMVADIHSARMLAGPSATVEAVLTAMDGASLVHLATHGRLHPRNPLFSSLRLADGDLTGYDLERLPQGPNTAILAACDSGLSAVRAGDDLLGLSATLLSRGTQQVVGSVVPIPDFQTRPFMISFHRFLASGCTTADALCRAQEQGLRHGDTTEIATAAGFVCIGAGLAPPIS